VRPWRVDGDDIILSVRLTPRNAKNGFGGLWTDAKDMIWLQAQVRAVPEKGRANEALIQLLAKTLSIPTSRIALATGDTSRLKQLRIAGGAEIETKLTGLLP
jgi:hypothetical protein